MFKQGTIVKAKDTIYFRAGNGRVVTFKPSDKLWIGSSCTNQILTNAVEVCRHSQKMGMGYRFQLDQARELFEENQ